MSRWRAPCSSHTENLSAYIAADGAEVDGPGLVLVLEEPVLPVLAVLLGRDPLVDRRALLAPLDPLLARRVGEQVLLLEAIGAREAQGAVADEQHVVGVAHHG